MRSMLQVGTDRTQLVWPAYPGEVHLAVGFDLDMTLVDSSDGIVATVQAALADFGVAVTAADVWPSMGLPLELILAPHLPPEQVAAATARYRELYPILGVPGTRLLPARSRPSARCGR
jgi:hypothetical protein